MNESQANAIMQEFEGVDQQLGWQEEKGILTEQTKLALYLVQIARPFLQTLLDIAESLSSIAQR